MKRGQKALTFIEIFLVVLILGIMMAFAIPSLKKTYNNLQLNSAARDLQTFMNYLNERSIVEGKVIYLNIDNEKKEYWAESINETTGVMETLKTYSFDRAISAELSKKIVTDESRVLFYPDGQIDKVTIKLTDPDEQSISLTTEGTFGKTKILPQE